MPGIGLQAGGHRIIAAGAEPGYCSAGSGVGQFQPSTAVNAA